MPTSVTRTSDDRTGRMTSAGFTLLEVLVVLTVLAVLTGTVMALLYRVRCGTESEGGGRTHGVAN